MTTTPWRKSSRSGGQGNCVEFRQDDDRFQIRDSKNPAGGSLTVTPAAFRAFIAGVKSGALDGPAS